MDLRVLLLGLLCTEEALQATLSVLSPCLPPHQTLRFFRSSLRVGVHRALLILSPRAGLGEVGWVPHLSAEMPIQEGVVAEVRFKNLASLAAVRGTMSSRPPGGGALGIQSAA